MQVHSLHGSWQVRSTDNAFRIAGTVPGSLFADLEASGHFGPQGISWRENNRLCEDIANREYVWERDFSLDPGFLASQSSPVFLEADGLDTLATILINGQEVARTRNMHRRYSFEVGQFLKAGNNHIAIHFGNALAFIKAAYERRPLWHSFTKTTEIAFPGFNMIRKSHCSFGWDWGPVVPDVGIWRALKLVRYETARLGDVRVIQQHQPGKVDLDIRAEWEKWTDDQTQVKALLHHPSGKTQELALEANGQGRLSVENPQLWWPNGLGEQPLYRLEILLTSKGKTLHSKELTIGLRTLRLRREPDAWGESFEFEVNGQSFFASGADYIPEDVALTRVSRDRTERLIRDSAAARFNCLRVWGGGVYPSDDFYDLCDQYGLVVWEDLMFACALYDINNLEFRDEIVAEVRDNVRRLRHHASLGLICGNNEMEWAFVEWNLPDIPATKTEYLLQYQHLFPQVLAEEAPELSYWPASPSSGGDFDNPNDPTRGDCHFWAVWHGNKDFSEYSKHYFRFMSEYGFESFPALKTIESFTEPGDRDILSPVMEDHQRCVGGNAKIISYMNRYFRTPEDFAATIYLSWLSQAEAIRHGIQHWRRNRGRCMGSVYWQLNDNWPVASWASIDSQGRWKALHYEARRSYNPQMVSAVTPDVETLDTTAKAHYLALPKPKGNGHFTTVPALVEIHLSNESFRATKAEIFWELLRFDGSVIEKGQTSCAVEAFGTKRALELDLSAPIQGRTAPRESLLSYRAELDDGQVLHGFHNFVPYKMLVLPKSHVKTQVRAFQPVRDKITGISAGTKPPAWVIEVQADAPALFVELDHPTLDLVLSDNFVFLDGKRSRRLVVERVCRDGVEIRVSAEELTTGLTVRHLSR